MVEQLSNSLTELLAKSKITVENHAIIRRLTNAIGVAGYCQRSGYIQAVRRDGGPDLWIHYGYTSGFTSEDEVVRVAGNVDRDPSTRRAEVWLVWHPTNGKHSGTTRSRNTRREAPFCDCGMQLSVTGVCGNCD